MDDMDYNVETEGGIVFLSEEGCYSEMGRKNKDALEIDGTQGLHMEAHIPNTWQYISGPVT